MLYIEANTHLCNIFVDHYGSLIRQQINSLGLNISVAWLGSELEHVISRMDGQPFLVLNWEPNTVSRAKQMTRISFPPCRCAFYCFVKILNAQSRIANSYSEINLWEITSALS